MTAILLITLLICLLLAVYGGLILWYLRAWKAIPSYDYRDPAISPFTAVTVIVPARNEEQNISACLRSLAGQRYPRHLFQVIVVDDHSTDKTWDIVQQWQQKLPFVRGIRLALPANGTAHKKLAIETGINAATGELIVTTDADCQFHPDWLRTLTAFYKEKNAKFIAAPVRIGPSKTNPNQAKAERKHTSFLSIFQTLDFITLQGITGAAVQQRFHSMCNGANLAYEKKAFYEVDGFRDIDAIPSGDDMLLMFKIYKRYPDQVFYLKSRQAIVSTLPETRWESFVNQRIRWASKADRYDDKRIFRVLLLVYIVNLLFPAMLIAAFWNNWWLWLFLILTAVKTIVEYPFVRSVAAFFGQDYLMIYFPWLQPAHILYTIVIGWLGKFGSYRWKDRKITK
jgi:cellulose synthase/poly-beta-1,6-N-acetylglucosamine synthase-like glycosyltransferase